MERLFRRFIDLIEWWAVFLLVLMVVLVSLGVFFRYVLNSALAWYDEFASYLLVWLTFYGSVVASYRGRHIALELVVDRLRPQVGRMLRFLGESLVLGFQTVLLYYGWLLTVKMGDETAISLVWIKMGWIYSVLPIAGGLMLIISIDRLVRIAFTAQVQKKGGATWSGSSSE